MKNMKKIQTELEGADRFEAGDPLAYHDRDQQFDMGHGCIVIDVIVDAATDAAADVDGDVVADSSADATFDVDGDVVADAAADGAAVGGLSPAASSRLQTLGLLLAGAVLDKATDAVMNAIKNARGSGSGQPATPATYWDALYTDMVNLYPCDTSASQQCPTVPVAQQGTQRDAQEFMVLRFANYLGGQGSNAQDATTFKKTWPTSNQQQLTDGLNGVSTTAGIPSMVKYMSSFQISGNPSATSAVINEANVFDVVAQFVFTD